MKKSMARKIKKISAIIGIFLGLGLIITYLSIKKTNLNTQAIEILVGLFIITGLISTTKYWIKYVVTPIGCLVMGFLLLIGIVPLYQNSPEIDLFQETRAIQYKIIANNTGSELIIEDTKTKKNIPIKSSEQIIYPVESPNITFSLTENKNKGNTIFFIQFPDETTFAIYPGTTFVLSKTGDNQRIIDKKKGKIEYYSSVQTSKIHLQNIPQANQKSKSDFIGKELLTRYENEKRSYIIDQMGGELMMNAILRNGSKKLLDIAYQIWPQTYKQNLINYQQYKKLLQREDTEEQSYTNINKQIQNHMVQEASKGLSETNLLKNRFK